MFNDKLIKIIDALNVNSDNLRAEVAKIAELLNPLFKEAGIPFEGAICYEGGEHPSSYEGWSWAVYNGLSVAVLYRERGNEDTEYRDLSETPRYELSMLVPHLGEFLEAYAKHITEASSHYSEAVEAARRIKEALKS